MEIKLFYLNCTATTLPPYKFVTNQTSNQSFQPHTFVLLFFIFLCTPYRLILYFPEVLSHTLQTFSYKPLGMQSSVAYNASQNCIVQKVNEKKFCRGKFKERKWVIRKRQEIWRKIEIHHQIHIMKLFIENKNCYWW